ncbi:hypothetical protein SmphiM6_101 [Sinorhizobium phage phiM6]|nr:hypothetical protein SmphiM6_101 [Sinorhizobium phage phiM6]
MNIVDKIESTDDWFQWEKEQRVNHRIACHELGYPVSEALYTSVSHWEMENKRSWALYLSEIL